MHFIENIIEPTKLLLAWQSSSEEHRRRYIVGELICSGDNVTLRYLTEEPDFIEAQQHKFKPYPAFPDTNKVHEHVLDAFMRRLPPRSRGDFEQYLEGLRLKLDAQMSDFALLGYSGAKLLSDGFSIIHPFNNAKGACELLIEAAGFRHQKIENIKIEIGTPVIFVQGLYEDTPEIRINIGDQKIGNINRGLIPTFLEWISQGRISYACVEKINGTPERPALYIYVKVAAILK